MFKSWRLGRIFGFPVEINLSFLLLLGVVLLAYGGLGGLLIVLLTFGSVLLHELGHAVVARRLGVYISGIELSFFGGAAKMHDMPRSANHEIAIAAAGPAVSLMLAGAGLGLGIALHVPFLSMIGWINLVLAAFNLIPALPMDGGRILRALLTHKMSFVRATDVAVTVSRVAAVGFVIAGLVYGWFQLVVLAPFLWLLGTRERMVAHAMGGDYAGFGGGSGGGDRFSRGAAPYDRDDHDDGTPSRGFWFRGRDGDHPGYGEPPRGFWSGHGEDEPAVRRFEVRRVGGRTVIVPLD
jgi:Zn-dependent protease